MFQRGFQGKEVGVVGPMKLGPVTFNAPGQAAPAAPLFGAPQQIGVQKAPAAAPSAPAKASCARPQGSAPANKPGTVPQGKKADCPVCRTFGK